MDEIKKRIVKNLARTVCRLTGSIKPYRRIMNLVNGRKDYTNRIECEGTNAFGFVLHVLGVDHARYPRYVDYIDFERFLLDNCIRSRKENCLIVAFRTNGDELEHSGIYTEPYFIHQADIGKAFRITTLDRFFLEDPSLKRESELEYYKFFPERMYNS